MSTRNEIIDGLIFLVAEVDASKASSHRKLYVHMKEIFQFPETTSNAYGDLLLDYMTDLGWLSEKNFKLIIRNVKKAEKMDPNAMASFHNSMEVLLENWTIRKARNGRDWEDNFIIEFADR